MQTISALLYPTTLLTVSAIALARPTAQQPPGTIGANLKGADGTHLTLDVPRTGEYTAVSKPVSISHVGVTGGPCTFHGADGVVVEMPAAGEGEVRPPRTIVGATCEGAR